MHCHLYLIQICIISNRSAQQDYLLTKLFFPDDQYETIMELNFFKNVLLYLLIYDTRKMIIDLKLATSFHI